MNDNNEIKLELNCDMNNSGNNTPGNNPLTEVEESHYLEDTNLSEAEIKQVNDFVNQIDLNNTNLILQYGSASQKKIAEFSDAALEGVKTKELEEVGDLINNLVIELKGFDLNEEKKGFLGLFKNAKLNIEKLKNQYADAEVNVNKIVTSLEAQQNQLTKDIVLFNKMYETNLVYFKELTMYILAGKKSVEIAKNTKLKELQAKANASGLQEDVQAASDFAANIERFEKKLLDLELTRTVSMQMAPQIRLIKNNDALMSERIQSTIVNTIPLWKNQMVLALGLAHSKEALEAQSKVNNLTNELLLKNAETLKTGSIEIARESEKTLIDIETVKKTNEQLITTLDEVLRIQEEGRIKRKLTENELGIIENQMKEKLLALSNKNSNINEQQ